VGRSNLAPTLLAGLSRQSIYVGMQSPRPVLDYTIVLGQGLNPSGENPFWLLEGLEPLKAVAVRPQNDLLPKDIVAEVLKGHDDGQQFPSGRTVVFLSPVEDLGKEGDGSLLPISDLTEDTSHGYIRSICIQNAGDIWPGVLQDGRLHECGFKPIE